MAFDRAAIEGVKVDGVGVESEGAVAEEEGGCGNEGVREVRGILGCCCSWAVSILFSLAMSRCEKFMCSLRVVGTRTKTAITPHSPNKPPKKKPQQKIN